jgi:hypothetical protein
MSTESVVRREMRFSALEYMVSHLCVTIYRASAVNKEQIDAVHKELLVKAATGTFPKFDPAMSDAAAFTFEESLLDLLNLQREMMGFPKLRG